MKIQICFEHSYCYIRSIIGGYVKNIIVTPLVQIMCTFYELKIIINDNKQ